MNTRRFDLLVTWVLLAFAAWYGLTMLSYPDGAGLVPAITAAVMAGALVVQLAIAYLRPAKAAPEVSAATTAIVAEEASTGSLVEIQQAVEENEPEPDTYESLIALRGVRRRRFITITLFACGFYVGAVLVGFVVTTGVLIAAILFASRERPHVALIGGALAAGAAYALVVSLLDMQPLQGYLIG